MKKSVHRSDAASLQDFGLGTIRGNMPQNFLTVSYAIEYILKHLNYFIIKKGGMLILPPKN
jgi:hypothetical protein